MGSRSETTRIVKRGGTEMEGVGRREAEEEDEEGGWGAVECSQTQECGVRSERSGQSEQLEGGGEDIGECADAV